MQPRPEQFVAAARAGDVNAMTALGKLLLLEPPPRPAEGLAWLQEAARRGGGGAAAQLAALAGAGWLVPQSWQGALDHLRRAAELGLAPARLQLGLIAGIRAPALADGGAALATWLNPSAGRILSEEPLIVSYPGFAPAAVCDWLTAKAAGRTTPAMVYHSQTGEAGRAARRSNTEFGLGLIHRDVVVELLRARMAAATGLAVPCMERPTVLRYEVGQAFLTHHDWLDPEVPAGAAEIERLGQRVGTFLVYLNDGFEGGETEFPELGLRHRGAKGDGLFFRNVDAGGAPDRRTVHAGLPPTSGEKWVLSQWIRSKPQPPG